MFHAIYKTLHTLSVAEHGAGKNSAFGPINRQVSEGLAVSGLLLKSWNNLKNDRFSFP
jgi:hypothetical protein